MNFETVIQLAAYVPLAFLLLWVAKKAADLTFGNADRATMEESNTAAGLRRGGIYLAVVLGIYGVMTTPSVGTLVNDLALTALDGLILVALILAAGYINDAFVLRGIDNRAEVAAGNVAVATVEFCAYVATGLIAYASFTGEGGGILSALVFFLLGQAALLVLIAVYEAVTRWDSLGEIRSGNLSAGLMMGGMLIALGIILQASLRGEFTSWGADIASFAVSAGLGIGALLVLLFPVDWLFLPATNFKTEIVRDRNVAAITVAASVQIAIAIIVTAVFI